MTAGPGGFTDSMLVGWGGREGGWARGGGLKGWVGEEGGFVLVARVAGRGGDSC